MKHFDRMASLKYPCGSYNANIESCSLEKTELLQLTVSCLLQMFLLHMLWRQYQQFNSVHADTDLLALHLMERYAPGNQKLEEEAMSILLSHLFASMALHRTFHDP